MEPTNQKSFASLGPFEIKGELITLAKRAPKR
jgi:hypothetical protein